MNRGMTGDPKLRWYLRFPRALPVALFLLVSGITALSVYAIERVEMDRTRAQHRQMAGVIAGSMQRLDNVNAAYLRAGAALLSQPQRITGPQFERFAAQISSDRTSRAATATGWGARIAGSDVPAFDAEQRAAGISDFAVHGPASASPWKVPVTLLYPDSSDNRVAYGYDMYAESGRRAAMDGAAASGRPTATGRVTLLRHDVAAMPSFIVFMPVYAEEGGGRRLNGFIYRTFVARAFVTSALESEQLSGYGVRLYDGADDASSLMAEATSADTEGSWRIRQPLILSDRAMMLAIDPPRGTTLSNLSLLTLLFGMLVAALLLVVARLVTTQAAEDRVALAWFEEQASIRNSLTRELNHRVKNTLANVLSIVSLTRRRSQSMDDFTEALNGRIRALSATHDLLTQSEWGTTPIKAVILAELVPYAPEGESAVQLRGPDVELAPNDALSLGMAIHELATNASKYGALSAPGGQVEVTWEMVTDRLARIVWQESGGPPVAQQRRRGFGTDLIEKIVAHELRNPVDLTFPETGVRCALVVPVRAPASFQIRAPKD